MDHLRVEVLDQAQGAPQLSPGLRPHPQHPQPLQSGEELYLRKLVGALGHEG